MKKKRLIVCLAIFSLLLAVGCGKNKEEIINNDTTQVWENANLEDKKNKIDIPNSTVENIDQDDGSLQIEYKEIKVQPSIYFSNDDEQNKIDKFVIIDEDGSAKKAVGIDELRSVSFVSDTEKDFLQECYFNCINEDEFILFDSYKLYVLNLKEESCIKVLDNDTFMIQGFDPVNGYLYVYGKYNNSGKYSEICYAKTDSGFISVSNTEMNDWLEQHADLSFHFNDRYDTPSGCLYGDGVMILSPADSEPSIYTAVFSDGRTETIELSKNSTFIYDYNSYFIDYHEYKEIRTVSCIYSFETKQSYEYEGFYDSTHLLGENILLRDDVSDDYFEHLDYHLYEYDPYKNSVVDIYQVPDKSDSLITIFIDTFYDKIYFQQKNKYFASIYSLEKTEKGYLWEEVYTLETSDHTYEYGEIYRTEKNMICETCNFDYADYLVEGFKCTLDCPGVEAINERLKAKYDKDIVYLEETFASDQTHEYDRMDDFGCFTKYIYVSARENTYDQLVVTYHESLHKGWSEYIEFSYEYIFDLNSGELLNIRVIDSETE